jgi:hypothetical protein
LYTNSIFVVFIKINKGGNNMKFQEELILTIIAGSREFIDQYRLNKVCNWIFAYKKIAYSDVKIISGTCRGADIMGENFAKTYNIPVKRFPADWKLYGKNAGNVRNRQMAEYASSSSSNNGVLIAFANNRCKGTMNMINLGIDYKLDVFVVWYEEQRIERYDYKTNQFVKL